MVVGAWSERGGDGEGGKGGGWIYFFCFILRVN